MKVFYLGQVVGYGIVTPIKVKNITDYHFTENKKSLMRFLGMVGYYSDVGAGAVVLQLDDKDIEHPICYFSHYIFS